MGLHQYTDTCPAMFHRHDDLDERSMHEVSDMSDIDRNE
jgi:hypothetical protein